MKENIFIILAAGKGTRMKNSLPKVMHEIAGKRMIDYSIDLSERFSPKEIICVISDDTPELKKHINNRNNLSSIFQKEKLGTGHAVKQCLDSLKNEENSNVVILYGDTPFIKEETIEKLCNEISNDNTSLCLIGFENSKPNKYGRLVLDDYENLIKITEFNDATEKEKNITLCNSGVIAFNGSYIKDVINKIDNDNSKGEYYLTDSVEISVAKDLKCKVVTVEEEEVLGVNSQRERADAEKIIQRDLRNKHLDNGVIMVDPETVYLCNDTEIGSGTIIHQNVIFGKNVKIAENCEIKPFTHIESAEIAEKVSVGPYARIRPETKIGKEARIGNFVEVKKSTIGKGSKINHLSYIGDTIMGDDVNVGAGTITCNYDGENKHITTIENECFIGSNSALVAPVKISYKSVIGAGTTVFKDTENNKVTINRKSQETIDKK